MITHQYLLSLFTAPDSDGTWSKFLTRVGSCKFFVAWVSHLWFGFGLGLEKFPLKFQKLQFFSLQIKKISSGRVKKYLGQRQVGLLFTAGQKYARVGLGKGPSLAPDDYY